MNTATLFLVKYGDKGGKTELSLDEKNIRDVQFGTVNYIYGAISSSYHLHLSKLF